VRRCRRGAAGEPLLWRFLLWTREECVGQRCLLTHMHTINMGPIVYRVHVCKEALCLCARPVWRVTSKTCNLLLHVVLVCGYVDFFLLALYNPTRNKSLKYACIHD
jgi:hypothetical protein